ncbi:MAG: hypothetical protein GXW85_10410 [Clostridia bacterium]|nr:hypothetical protein [Clostridia bacterium]
MGKRFPFFMFLWIFLYCFIFISGYTSVGIIPDKVYIEGIEIGGLTKQEALGKVKEYFSHINFTYQNFYCSFTPEELGIEIDYESSFKLLEDRQILQRVEMNFQDTHFTLVKRFDLNKLERTLKLIGEGINKPAQNAAFEIIDGQPVAKPESRGTKLEEEILLKKITDGALKNHYIIPVGVVEPSITAKELEELKPFSLLGQYTTKFVKNYNRTENIKLACEAIKNTLLAPGEVFSFNDVVGPREEERGYLTAMVIQGGEFVPGLGGGVCQVSSTLYNCVLSAGLEIVERHRHSLPVGYVPPGQDATVVYGLKDFKFKNNTQRYLLLDYHIEDQNLTIFVFGSKEKAA